MMSRLLGSFAAGALFLALALPGSAGATELRKDGNSAKSATEITEFSSHRRSYRHSHRQVRRYYAPRRYYAAPRYYQPYAYAPAPYYGRPYYPQRYYGGPGVSFGFRF